MITMYEIMRSKIANGNYKLHEVQTRIKRLFLLGDLTEEQLDELMAMAVNGASADAERPENEQLIDVLAAKIADLEARVKVLESGGNSGTDDSEGEEQTEYPEWKPWDGISKDYEYGAIVSHNGELWESIFNGQNVWEPGAVGTDALWRKYTEPEETLEQSND